MDCTKKYSICWTPNANLKGVARFSVTNRGNCIVLGDESEDFMQINYNGRRIGQVIKEYLKLFTAADPEAVYDLAHKIGARGNMDSIDLSMTFYMARRLEDSFKGLISLRPI